MTPSQPNLLGASPSVPWRIRALQSGIVLLIAVIGGLSWQMLWGSRNPEQSTASISDSLSESSEPQPSAAQSRIPKPVSTDTVVSLALGVRGDTLRYYEEKTGRAFSYSPLSGKTDTLSDVILSGFMHSYWLPGVEQVISAFDEKGATKFRHYDYATQETTPVGSSVTALAVSPDGRRIAYADAGDGPLTLYIANADGSSPVKIIETRATSVQVSWPAGGDSVMMASRRADRAGWDLTSLGTDGSISSVLSDKENLEFLWAADGRSLIYSYFVPDDGIQLFWHDLATGSDVPLDIPTSARKCAWLPSGISLVCGIPAKTALARDVPADSMATTDDIVRIEMASGIQTTLFKVPAGTLLGIIDPVITPSGNFFAFRNLFDKRLYTYDLR